MDLRQENNMLIVTLQRYEDEEEFERESYEHRAKYVNPMLNLTSVIEEIDYVEKFIECLKYFSISTEQSRNALSEENNITT